MVHGSGCSVKGKVRAAGTRRARGRGGPDRSLAHPGGRSSIWTSRARGRPSAGRLGLEWERERAGSVGLESSAGLLTGGGLEISASTRENSGLWQALGAEARCLPVGGAQPGVPWSLGGLQQAAISHASCRKELVLRKEKTREPLLEGSQQAVPAPTTPPGEVRPLVAKDQVAGLRLPSAGPGGEGQRCTHSPVCRVLGTPGTGGVCPLHGGPRGRRDHRPTWWASSDLGETAWVALSGAD